MSCLPYCLLIFEKEIICRYQASRGSHALPAAGGFSGGLLVMRRIGRGWILHFSGSVIQTENHRLGVHGRSGIAHWKISRGSDESPQSLAQRTRGNLIDTLPRFIGSL